ncbi:MAG: hypothetical protein HFF50_03510 [Lawsonibacter sp.]|nr:hypothetical protein [Lawsonibacter sp.]
MFGYVRPLRAELRCRDFDLYQGTYCGLCRCLGRRCGPLAPATLTFDCTFLALLLWELEEELSLCAGRCRANPLRKRSMCCENPALEWAADTNLMLAWWKLQDTAADDGLWEGMPARALGLALEPAYRRAAERHPDFDASLRENLSCLARLEEEGCPSIDRAADPFARLLQSAVPPEHSQARVLRQLLYHLGRWIYLLDAQDDLEEDRQAGRYNPVTARYGPQGDDEALGLLLDLCLEQMGAAFQLGEYGQRRVLLENILYLGLPLVQRAVLDGSWARMKKEKIWRNSP